MLLVKMLSSRREAHLKHAHLELVGAVEALIYGYVAHQVTVLTAELLEVVEPALSLM